MCREKKPEAQRILYDLLLPYLEMLSRRYLRDESFLKDVLQESFIRIFKSINQFDERKASFKTWASKIVINNCLKCNTQNGKVNTVEFVINLHDRMIDAKVLDDMTNEEILAFLKNMPSEYFEVFNLYIIDGFSHKEISKMLNISPSLSRQRLTRSRAWLKKRIGLDKRFIDHFFPDVKNN